MVLVNPLQLRTQSMVNTRSPLLERALQPRKVTLAGVLAKGTGSATGDSRFSTRTSWVLTPGERNRRQGCALSRLEGFSLALL